MKLHENNSIQECQFKNLMAQQSVHRQNLDSDPLK